MKNEKVAIATLFFGTVAVISDIYVAQPILPLLSSSFGVSHTAAIFIAFISLFTLCRKS